MPYKQGHPYQDKVEGTSEKREQVGVKGTPIIAGRAILPVLQRRKHPFYPILYLHEKDSSKGVSLGDTTPRGSRKD